MTTPAAHRGSNRFGFRFARTGPRSEDAQPNESVNRRQRQPPTVNSVAHSRRSWWGGRGRGQSRPQATTTHSVARERTGSSTRRVPPSTPVRHPVPYARPHSLATAVGTGWPNAAQSSCDTGARSPRPNHSASTPEMLSMGTLGVKCQKLAVGSPSVEAKLETPAKTMASRIASPVSPVSSETLISDYKVKVERISPEYAQPQPITSGSKLYAPLPPECRKSHPNHAAARSAWARKEQEALRRLGLRVVRSFIREDGMVIDWEAVDSELTDMAAVIERALMLNDPAVQDPPSGGVGDANRIRRECQTQPSHVDHMDIGDDAVASVHTPAPITCFLDQTTSNPHPSTPTSMRSSSQSSHVLHGRSTSPRRLSSPPPSQPALNTLHHILMLKRQISRSSSSADPSAVSPSPSYSLPRPHPPPKEPPHISPLKRPAESSADVVAAALNESARLSQGGSSMASASSTPLRLYKRRRAAAAILPRVKGESNSPRDEPRHRARDSLSPQRHSSPPVIVLPPGLTPWSPLTELTPSVSGDELDFAYPPPSPGPHLPDTISHHTPGEVLAESPQPEEPTEPNGGEPSLSSLKLPSPEEKTAVQSAALQFLQRYGQTFDTDQRALGEAYAPHATFSCPSRGLRTQGRDGILDALTRLGHGALCSERDVAYDVISVPGVGVLLVVLGTMIRAQDEKDVGYTMSFVLQRRDHEDRESGRGTGQWPFVVVMHQIVLRENS